MYTFEDWVDSKLKHEITHAHTHTLKTITKSTKTRSTPKDEKKSNQVPSLVKVSRVHLYP
jgi:hypothetical protein